MTWERHALRRGVVHVTRAEHVYPTLDAGSVTLVISDGPYGMGRAAWDRQRGEDGLRDWYRPHVEAWGRVCAPAASVYVWGTDDSASALRPLMREHGWTKRVRVVWDKVSSLAAVQWKRAQTWIDVTEVCDVYARGRFSFDCPSGVDGFSVWRFDLQNGMRNERLWAADLKPDPVNPELMNREAVHPCQKPLAFYDRIIRASSRPGDLVLEPFGGTLRAAVACERLPERDARRYVCVEPDEDGRGYVPAVLASMGYAEHDDAHPLLFGGRS